MANVLATTGKTIAAARMTGAGAPSQAEPKQVGIGTGAGTSAVGDTTLFTEVTTGNWAGYARVAGTTSSATNVYQIIATFTNPGTTNPITITNAGSFDAATVGNLFIKGDFTGIPLNTNDSLQLTFTATFA